MPKSVSELPESQVTPARIVPMLADEGIYRKRPRIGIFYHRAS